MINLFRELPKKQLLLGNPKLFLENQFLFGRAFGTTKAVWASNINKHGKTKDTNTKQTNLGVVSKEMPNQYESYINKENNSNIESTQLISSKIEEFLTSIDIKTPPQ